MEGPVLLHAGALPVRRRRRAEQDGGREGADLRHGQATLHRRGHRPCRGLPLPRHPGAAPTVPQVARPGAGHDPGVRPHHETQAVPPPCHLPPPGGELNEGRAGSLPQSFHPCVFFNLFQGVRTSIFYEWTPCSIYEIQFACICWHPVRV